MKIRLALFTLLTVFLFGCKAAPIDEPTNQLTTDTYDLNSAMQDSNQTNLPEQANDELLNVTADQTIYATIKTSKGDIKLELYPESAPTTVANFVGLAEGTKQWVDPVTGEIVTDTPYYNGVIFHRVIENFMIQSGDRLGTGTGGPGYKFEDEIDPALVFDGPGLLAMANAGPNTNGSQFFITHAETPWLNGKHTIFGKVVEGMDVVDVIATVEVIDPISQNNKPVEDVVIEEVVIERV